MKELQNKSILVIDDDAETRHALQKILSGKGAVVTCAEWAGDAVDILTKRDKRIDLVITDLRMPMISGVTIVYAVHEIFPTLPVIVLTGFTSPDLKEECRKQGAAAFLDKPLRTTQLMQAIGSVLGQTTGERERDLTTRGKRK